MLNMVTHIEQIFDDLQVRFSSKFIVVFIILTAVHSFGLKPLVCNVHLMWSVQI